MGDVLICAFCKKSSDEILLFSEETLKKCKTILQLRKKHNLKYHDVISPREYTDGGYHGRCYKSFTGLMKKYYTPSTSSQKANIEKTSVSTSTENSFSATSIATKSLLPISEPTSILQAIERQATTSTENNDIPKFEEVSEHDDSILEVNIPAESDANINKENMDYLCQDGTFDRDVLTPSDIEVETSSN
ncbi:hypothetical protein PV325_012250, partial [Microctonus aethiopoides]